MFDFSSFMDRDVEMSQDTVCKTLTKKSPVYCLLLANVTNINIVKLSSIYTATTAKMIFLVEDFIIFIQLWLAWLVGFSLQYKS